MSAPVVTGLKKTVLLSNSIAASELFTAFDSDDAIVSYFVQDYDRRPTSGYFTFNGSAIPQGTFFKLSANDLSLLRYVGGNQVGSERVRIMAQDLSRNLSNSLVTATLFSARANVTAPYSRAITFNIVADERIEASKIVWGFDPDGHQIESFSIRDRSVDDGKFVLNGIAKTQGVFFTVAAEELINLRYETTGNTRSELFDVIAFDGAQNSLQSVGFANTSANENRPEVRFSRASVQGNGVVKVVDVFNIGDADGNTIKKYRFYNDSADPTAGKLVVNGLIQPRQTWIEVNGADRDLVDFVSVNRNETQKIRGLAFDGKNWSNENNLEITNTFVAPPPPIIKPVFKPNVLFAVAEQLENVVVKNLFTKLDSGMPYVSYEIFDPDADTARGYFARQGIPLAAQQIYQMTANEFENQTTFYTGAFFDRSLDTVYVRANNNQLWGAWQKLDIRTEPEIYDVLGTGTGWLNLVPKNSLGQPIISFSFMQQVPTYGGATIGSEDDQEHFEPFDAGQRANARLAFRHLETIANVQFLEVSDTSINSMGGDGGLIRMGEHGDADADFAAFAYFPGNGVGGDMWFNRLTMDTSFRFGGSGYTTFLHELGHAMGMKHPHDGTPRLPPTTDFDDFTVMSYNGSPNGNPVTYQLYDIYRLQDMYGANMAYNSGDNVYSIAKTWGGSQRLYRTIWDGGGIDTLSAVGSENPATVDLRSGQPSSLGNKSNNVNIGLGAVIENGIGSRHADFLFGNAADNYLGGLDGDDYLFGNGGNDNLNGGGGNDTYEFGVADGNDIIDEASQGGNFDRLLITPFAGLDSLSDDFRFRLFGNDLFVNLTLNGGDSQGTVRIRNQHLTDNQIETLELNGSRIDLQSIFTQATTVETSFSVLGTFSANGFLVAPV